MTDLSTVLLSPSNRDNVNTAHGVDLKDLKKALDKVRETMAARKVPKHN
jgi:pyridoxine 5'-phosphate synthase PdxJ